MKRNKKPNKAAFGQLSLFETPSIRQQEEKNRTKPKKKARRGFKNRRPYMYTTRTG